jgi:hypothetical protein
MMQVLETAEKPLAELPLVSAEKETNIHILPSSLNQYALASLIAAEAGPPARKASPWKRKRTFIDSILYFQGS